MRAFVSLLLAFCLHVPFSDAFAQGSSSPVIDAAPKSRPRIALVLRLCPAGAGSQRRRCLRRARNQRTPRAPRNERLLQERLARIRPRGRREPPAREPGGKELGIQLPAVLARRLPTSGGVWRQSVLRELRVLQPADVPVSRGVAEWNGGERRVSRHDGRSRQRNVRAQRTSHGRSEEEPQRVRRRDDRSARPITATRSRRAAFKASISSSARSSEADVARARISYNNNHMTS